MSAATGNIVYRFTGYAPGEYRVPCECTPHRKNLGLKIESDGSMVWNCFACPEKGRNGIRRAGHFQPLPELEAKPGLQDWAADTWQEARPVDEHTSAGQYLLARGCALPPGDGDVHQVERLRHPSGYIGPALVALVTHAITNEPLSIHRTWVRVDGRKAAVSPPRLLAKGHKIPHGVIRIWPDEAINYRLGLAEGMETALTVARVFTPIWSSIDAGHMARFPVLAGVDALTVFADNDDSRTGLKSAEACASRWRRARRKAHVLVASKGDFNDLVNGRG